MDFFFGEKKILKAENFGVYSNDFDFGDDDKKNKKK